MQHLTAPSAIEPPDATTLVELLHANALTFPDKRAFCFVRGHGEDGVSLTYRALHERAMAIGAELQALMPPGERALLFYPPGLDFIATFLGCLYAGVVAVPVALPARNRSTAHVEAILNASNPALILSTTNQCSLAKQTYSQIPMLLDRPWIATDSVSNDRQHAWRDPRVGPRQAAFLQFTSGSTSSPKGAVLSHENVLQNAALIRQAFGNTPQSRGVFWLPQYHDMGLIGGVVQPIYCGGSCTFLAPAAFLQRPALWLETISRTEATVSGGPDFAYNLCVRKIPPQDRAQLDLSSWTVAFTGAERVRAETIERFVEAFAPCGFRREAFFPCYGLAEATLMVSGGPRLTAPTIVRVSADALARNRVRETGVDDSAARRLVGCGQNLPGQRTVIVEPRTRLKNADGEVGEIWVQGPSVAGGYYGCPEATQAAFNGYLSDSEEGPFLRTGDLGFLREGQLFVTGRLKDVIVIRGRNFYPEDIEHAVDGAHPAFRAGSCVAFSVDVQDEERLVVVQEIEPRTRILDADAALTAIRRAVAKEHELDVFATLLAKAGQIPKTSSGKTQRSACRERYLSGQFELVAQWRAIGDAVEDETRGANGSASPRFVTVGEAERWLIRRVKSRLGLPSEQIRITTPFLEFGMGSVDAVEIAADLERWLGRRISPTVVYNFPNINALAQWLANPPPDGEPSLGLYQARVSLGDVHSQQLLDDVQSMTNEDMNEFILHEMAKQEKNE